MNGIASAACLVGNSSGVSLPSLFLSLTGKTSDDGVTATRRPGSFSPDPKPLIKSVSPSITGTDFSSNDSPPTHQSRLPVSAVYAFNRNDPGRRICFGPLFGA